MEENIVLIIMIILAVLFIALGYNWSGVTTEIYINFMIYNIEFAIVGIILGYLFMHFKHKYDQENQNQLNQIRHKIDQQFQTQQTQLLQLEQNILNKILYGIFGLQNELNAQTAVVGEISEFVKGHHESINSIDKFLVEHNQQIAKLFVDNDESNKNNDLRFDNFQTNHQESVINQQQLIDKLETNHYESHKNYVKQISKLETEYNSIHKIYGERIDKLETDYNKKLKNYVKRINKLETDLHESNRNHDEQLEKLEIATHLESNPFCDYNILLLGEIGVGKSTAINSFANYMKYAKFEDSLDSNIVELIPSKFVMMVPSASDPVVIESGKDAHNSMTKKPRTYKFNYDNKVIRFIDTPAIGGANRIEQDKVIFQQIFSMCQYYKNLNGIIILMKSTESKQADFLQNCFAELFTHFPTISCENIVFCFNFSRNSFYGPGEGFFTLKTVLKGGFLKVPLNLTPNGPNQNCFFIDNEAYQFLVAKRQGIPFTHYIVASVRESWNKSKEAVEKMLAKIIDNKPHELQNITPMNSA